MERTKRRLEDTVQDNNENKKRNLGNESNFLCSLVLVPILNTKKSRFEYLANETIYEIFEYLDVYHIYQIFFSLNSRFRNLLINTNLPIRINAPTISKSDFEHYHQNMILPNKHRINYLRLSNPCAFDIIFSSPRIILEFIRLERLILDNIDRKHLNNILQRSVSLPNFHSLVINLIEYDQSLCILFRHLFRLSKLKSCKITYQSNNNKRSLASVYCSKYDYSPIEYLVINSRFPFELFINLLCYLPQLRYLSVDCLVKSHYHYIMQSPIILKDLKNVSLSLDSINFNLLEPSIKSFFPCIEVLRLTTNSDQTYLDARTWKQLILSSLPNLRVFDIHHDGFSLIYHDLIRQFNSAFWIDKQWFFTHQHGGQQRFDNPIFYSTNPYRRKDYTFHWQSEQQCCPHVQETNLTSVKHLYICSKQATNNCVNYFPSVNELTIKHYFQTSDDSISTTLNRLLPLKQLTKLVIQGYNFPFEEIIKLIRFTPNVHTLKLNLLCFNETNSKLIEQSENFQYVSKTNEIKTLQLRQSCTLENIQMIMTLFPQVEYLETRTNRKEIQRIIRFLFSKTSHQTRRLFFLCISQIPKVCLEELKMLIKVENLLKDYSIKYFNRDLYLWW